MIPCRAASAALALGVLMVLLGAGSVVLADPTSGTFIYTQTQPTDQDYTAGSQLTIWHLLPGGLLNGTIDLSSVGSSSQAREWAIRIINPATTTAAGHLSASFTDLTLSYFGFRGAMVERRLGGGGWIGLAGSTDTAYPAIASHEGRVWGLRRRWDLAKPGSHVALTALHFVDGGGGFPITILALDSAWPVAPYLTLLGEFAATRGDRAWRGGLTWARGPLTLGAEYRWVGPQFPTVGNQVLVPDRQGMILRGEWRPTPRTAFQGRSERYRNNVAASAVLPTSQVVLDRFSAAWAPAGWPSLLAGYQFTKAPLSAGDMTGTFLRVLSLQANQPFIGGTILGRVDRTEFWNGSESAPLPGTLRQGVTLTGGWNQPLGQIGLLSLFYVNDRSLAPDTGIVQGSSSWEAALTRSWIPGKLTSVTAFRLNGNDQGQGPGAQTVSARGNLSYNFSPDTALTLEWEQHRFNDFSQATPNTGGSILRLQLFRAFTVGSAPPGSTNFGTATYSSEEVLDRGSIEGVVFDDRNGNGVQDPGEPGIPGLVVSLSGGLKTVTTQDGFFQFPFLLPGAYLVESSPANIPLNQVPLGPTRATVTVDSGTVSKVAFRVAQMGSLRGVVYFDLDGNGRRDPKDPGVPDAYITLSNTNVSTFTNEDGSFSLEDVPSGEVTVSLSADSLPPETKLETPGQVTIEVLPGAAAGPVEFGIVIVPRPIRKGGGGSQSQ